LLNFIALLYAAKGLVIILKKAFLVCRSFNEEVQGWLVWLELLLALGYYEVFIS